MRLFQLGVDQKRSLHILETDEFLILKVALFYVKETLYLSIREYAYITNTGGMI